MLTSGKSGFRERGRWRGRRGTMRGGGWSGDKRKRAGQEREMLDVERDLKKVKEREEK